MAKKDLVKEFKNKVHQLEEVTGYKYKIFYKDYKGALENGRLHVFWHKPCKLAEVTTPEGVVTFEVTGELRMELMSPEGPVMTIEDCLKPLTPFDTTTIDDVGISHDGISVSNDKELMKYLKKKDWYFDVQSASYVQATFGDKTYEFEDPSIAKDIFDINVINEIIATEDESVEKEPVSASEPEVVSETVEVVAEPEVDSEPEEIVEEPVLATEEVVEEPVHETEKVKEVKEKVMPIKDSGDRTKFESGAVRDRQAGKGRCDLLPLDIVGEFFECEPGRSEFEEISLFQEDHDRTHLIKAAKVFAGKHFDCDETAILEYACHMEDGCLKYGDRNWELGIPVERYVDSGIRHLLKCRRGDDDERHDRAFMWNMLCGAWTVKHHPELI